MAIPASLRESLHSPVFWALYFFADADAPDFVSDLAEQCGEDFDDEDDESSAERSDVEATFDVGGGYKLLLDGDHLEYSLGLRTPDPAFAVELCQDSPVHGHPLVLRWPELDLICRAAAALDPGLPHPGPALALLCRFAAVFDDDDVPAAAAAVDAAFASLRPAHWAGFWPDSTFWLPGADFRGQKVTWHRAGGNQWASQEDNPARYFHSFRLQAPDDAENFVEFPYPEFRALLAAAMATLGTSPD